MPAEAITDLTHTTTSSLLQKQQQHASTPSQLLGFITLVIAGGILILLTGLTFLGAVIYLILFSPLILLSSPIWIPIGAILLVTVAGLLSMWGFGVASLAGLMWMYEYFKGMRPPGSDRADYARWWIFDTARKYLPFWDSMDRNFYSAVTAPSSQLSPIPMEKREGLFYGPVAENVW